MPHSTRTISQVSAPFCASISSLGTVVSGFGTQSARCSASTATAGAAGSWSTGRYAVVGSGMLWIDTILPHVWP